MYGLQVTRKALLNTFGYGLAIVTPTGSCFANKTNQTTNQTEIWNETSKELGEPYKSRMRVSMGVVWSLPCHRTSLCLPKTHLWTNQAEIEHIESK